MTLKLAQFCDDPQKISTKKTQVILKFRILNQKKKSPSLRMCENIRVTPWEGHIQGMCTSTTPPPFLGVGRVLG